MDLNDEKRILLHVFEGHKILLQEKILNNTTSQKVIKNAKLSELARKEGNALFSINKHNDELHKQIFAHYCRSIVLAPLKSEQLAFAYGNRSAFLMHLGRYNESIIDSDRALDVPMSNHFRVKLLCRKVECLKALGKPYENILNECQACAQKIDYQDKDKDKISELLKKTMQPQMKNIPKVIIDSEDHQLKNSKTLPEKIMNHSDHVIINYNRKYGRHLIAARDFEPGEIIFGEEMYAAIFFFEQNHTNCAHCFKVCWTGVACDYCSWMFCSEKCKEEAWQKYHDVECKIFALLTELQKPEDPYDFLPLRLLIMGIKEMGSVANLKREWESLDKYLDPSTNLCYDGKMISMSFRNIYYLASQKNRREHLDLSTGFKALKNLFCLIKTTSLFGENHKSKDIERLMENEDTLFIGTFLFQLFLMSSRYAYGIRNDCPKVGYIRFMGAYIPILSSLTNHSCFPNIDKVVTPDKKIIVFALQPIKKNSQIFVSYQNSEFHKVPKSIRIKLRKNFGFICDCTPCRENWPTFDDMFKQDMLDQKTFVQKVFLLEEIAGRNLIHTILQDLFQSKYSLSIQACENQPKNQIKYIATAGKTGFSQFDINALSNLIIKTMIHFKQPDAFTMGFIDALVDMFRKMYSIKFDESINFGSCKFMKVTNNC